jgi:hypothetical protein
VLWLRFSFDYTRGAKVAAGYLQVKACSYPEMVDALIPVAMGLSGFEPAEEELTEEDKTLSFSSHSSFQKLL